VNSGPIAAEGIRSVPRGHARVGSDSRENTSWVSYAFKRDALLFWRDSARRREHWTFPRATYYPCCNCGNHLRNVPCMGHERRLRPIGSSLARRADRQPGPSRRCLARDGCTRGWQGPTHREQRYVPPHHVGSDRRGPSPNIFRTIGTESKLRARTRWGGPAFQFSSQPRLSLG
jgi:hypothetical protein